MHFELHKSEALNRQRYWLSSNEITDVMICLLLWEWSISSQHGKVRGLLHGAEEDGREQSVHAFHGAIACGVTKGIHLFCLRSHLLGTS